MVSAVGCHGLGIRMQALPATQPRFGDKGYRVGQKTTVRIQTNGDVPGRNVLNLVRHINHLNANRPDDAMDVVINGRPLDRWPKEVLRQPWVQKIPRRFLPALIDWLSGKPMSAAPMHHVKVALKPEAVGPSTSLDDRRKLEKTLYNAGFTGFPTNWHMLTKGSKPDTTVDGHIQDWSVLVTLAGLDAVQSIHG